jgi:DNA-binding beta-propeller fold protein YncE
VVAVILVLSTFARATQPAEEKSTAGVATVDDMPAVLDPRNLYSEAGAGHLSPAVNGALERVYVPEVRANRVDVIDPATFNVVDQFRAGPKPQHVIPSWDLKTLWVAGSGRRHSPGSLTPIDPLTGKPGATIRNYPLVSADFRHRHSPTYDCTYDVRLAGRQRRLAKRGRMAGGW